MNSQPDTDPDPTMMRVEMGFAAMQRLNLDAKEQAGVFGRTIRSDSQLRAVKCGITDGFTDKDEKLIESLVQIALCAGRRFGKDETKLQEWMENPDDVLGYSPKVMLSAGNQEQVDKVHLRIKSLAESN